MSCVAHQGELLHVFLSLARDTTRISREKWIFNFILSSGNSQFYFYFLRRFDIGTDGKQKNKTTQAEGENPVSASERFNERLTTWLVTRQIKDGTSIVVVIVVDAPNEIGKQNRFQYAYHSLHISSDSMKIRNVKTTRMKKKKKAKRDYARALKFFLLSHSFHFSLSLTLLTILHRELWWWIIFCREQKSKRAKSDD